MRKLALLAVVIILLMASTAVAQEAPPPAPNSIRVRDYTTADCVADDTEGINAAIADWQEAARLKIAGVLDFGSGCYRTTDTLHFGRPDGQFLFGTIRGDSPVLAQIHPAASVPVAADIKMLKYSSVSGIGFYGSSTANSIGLHISSYVLGMGSNNLQVEQLVFQNFGTCLKIGDNGGQAAAELTFTQLQVQTCNIGIYATAQNTLDLTFINLTLAANQTGFLSDSAHQINFIGGGGQGNRQTFNFRPAGHFSLRGWREEPPMDRWLKAGCCNAGTWITIEDTMVYGNGVTPSIETGGDVYLAVSNSFIGGRISVFTYGGATIITGSAIYDDAPWVTGPNSPYGNGMFYRTEGNYKPAGVSNPAELTPKVSFTNQTGRALNGKTQP